MKDADVSRFNHVLGDAPIPEIDLCERCGDLLYGGRIRAAVKRAILFEFPRLGEIPTLIIGDEADPPDYEGAWRRGEPFRCTSCVRIIR
jgi:hypothetical protein